MDKFKAELLVKPGARPQFCQPRPVPFPMEDVVDRELDRCEDVGVLEKVTRNVGELCSFLGMINYYGKFVPNLCEDAFQAAKNQLSSSPSVWQKTHPVMELELSSPMSCQMGQSTWWHMLLKPCR